MNQRTQPQTPDEQPRIPQPHPPSPDSCQRAVSDRARPEVRNIMNALMGR